MRGYAARRRPLYAAILAEHSERTAFFARKAEMEGRMVAVDPADARDPVEIAKAANRAIHAR